MCIKTATRFCEQCTKIEQKFLHPQKKKKNERAPPEKEDTGKPHTRLARILKKMLI